MVYCQHFLFTWFVGFSLANYSFFDYFPRNWVSMRILVVLTKSWKHVISSSMPYLLCTFRKISFETWNTHILCKQKLLNLFNKYCTNLCVILFFFHNSQILLWRRKKEKIKCIKVWNNIPVSKLYICIFVWTITLVMVHPLLYIAFSWSIVLFSLKEPCLWSQSSCFYTYSLHTI